MRALLVAVLALCACRSEADQPKANPVAPPKVAERAPVSDVTAADYPMPALPHTRVTLVDAFGYKHAVDAEVAATPAARTRGLMWRTSLAEGQGMLFIFPEEERLTFWMKNTLIPLDMIFITAGQVIVGIEERTEPRTLSARGPVTPALYVLEVPAGWASKIGLRVGLKVQLEGLKALPPAE